MSMIHCFSCDNDIDTEVDVEHLEECTIETGSCFECGSNVSSIKNGLETTYECLGCGNTITS